MKHLYRTLSAVTLLMLSVFGYSQNYIGLHKDRIREKVRLELNGFFFTKEIFNDNRSFIKFENTFEEQTLLFVLNSKGYCTSVSRMYNTWLFNRLKDELTAKYGKSKTMKWIEIRDSEKFEVQLVKGEWFVTVITRKKR